MFDQSIGVSPLVSAADAYDDGMRTSASDVAAEIRARIPGVPIKKLHKLLYFCQGYHLAATGEAMFRETVSAWDMGPVVGQLWKTEDHEGPGTTSNGLDNGRLNTVAYVVSRYGLLSGRDLEILTHSEDPWRRADDGREPGGSVRIELEWLESYFSSATASEAREHGVGDSGSWKRWLADAPSRRNDVLVEDDLDALRARAL